MLANIKKYQERLEKLLEVICESKPFEVNYTKIAALSEISRVKLYDYLSYLHDGQMLLMVDENGDFLIDKKYTVEVGGKNKDFSQIKDTPNSFVAADDIEIGSGNKIPLWLFGFLY